MTREIGLVSCVKGKRDDPAIPKDLYTSAYSEKMRAYAEANHDEWWILSAKHGLLSPDADPIAPYDATLAGAPVAEKRDWVQTVAEQLADAGLLSTDVVLVFHVGKDYYEELLPLIEQRVDSIEIPTESLGIGETLAWYNDRI